MDYALHPVNQRNQSHHVIIYLLPTLKVHQVGKPFKQKNLHESRLMKSDSYPRDVSINDYRAMNYFSLKLAGHSSPRRETQITSIQVPTHLFSTIHPISSLETQSPLHPPSLRCLEIPPLLLSATPSWQSHEKTSGLWQQTTHFPRSNSLTTTNERRVMQ
jgi:hypothetical protein